MRRRRAVGLGLASLSALTLAAVGGADAWLRPERPWAEATGWERVPAAQRPLGGDLFAGTAMAADPPRLRWLGHSGFVLDWKGRRLVLDPNLSPRCTIARRALERPVSAGALGRVDAALVSHAHFDHLDLPTLSGLAGLGAVVVPRGSEGYVESLAGSGTVVVGLDPGESLVLGELEVVAVPAAHNGNRFHPLASRELALGYVVRSAEGAIYYAGDTGPGNDFAAIRERYAPEVAILPIGAYSPRFPMRRYHLGPVEAVAAARDLGVRALVPCHFGTFQLALDRPATALPAFAAEASAAGVRWVMPALAAPARDGEV